MLQSIFTVLIGCAHVHDHETNLPDGDEVAGEILFDGKCAACHGASAEGASAPSILEQPDAHFVSAVQEGIGNMPAFPDLTDQDIADIIAFVRTLEN